MGDFFNSKKKTAEVEVAADPYGGIRNSLSSWLQGQIGKSADQYTGDLVSPMTDQEKASFDWLRKYTDQPTSQGMSLANEEVRKTMQGEYDPTTSPYYHAVKAEAARNLADTQDTIKDAAAGGGRFWTGARLNEQGQASTDYGIALNKLLGGMAETERQRRLDTVPIAAQLGQYEEAQPLQKAQALQSLGALPRNIQDAYNQAIYNEWLRATQEYPLNIAQIAAGVQQAPLYGQVGYAPSGFDKVLGYGQQIANIIGTMYGGG